MSLLISPEELATALQRGEVPRLLDVRWRLDRPDGRGEYLDGHLPGAVFVDLEHELARHGEPDEGRHPLPDTAELQAAARRWGLDDGDTVVVYDEGTALSAARAWWLLRGSGVADVRVLDGGLQAWVAAGLPLERDDVRPAAGSVVLRPVSAGLADIDGAAAWPEHGVLIDVRAAERYRGEVEPVDPIAGHIPGAVSLPTTVHLESGRFRDAEAIRAAFASVGVEPGTPVAAYCGSGVTAMHTAFAGALAGIDITVYPGSWSQWSNTPGRSVAMGAQH